MNIDNKALGRAVWNNIYQNKFAFYSKAVLLQLILTKAGSFLLRFVFRLVLASAGEDNLTAHNILDILSKPPSFLLLIIFVMLVSGFILLEFSVLTIMVYCSYKKVRFLWKNNLIQ